jgi:hypothetical protein
LVFKADERVRVVVAVRIAGLPQEVIVDAEFKATFGENWGPTLMQM